MLLLPDPELRDQLLSRGSRIPLLLALASGCAGGGDSAATADSAAAAEGCEVPTHAAGGGGEPSLALDAPPRDLVILSLDTLRRDALGRYGGAGTDWLDQRAAEGLVLEDHRSCANWTLDAMTCALTGLDSLEAGALPLNALGVDAVPLPDATPLLAEVLSEAGFAGGLVAANSYLGQLDRGYDEVTLAPMDDLPALRETILGTWASIEGADRRLLHVHAVEPHSPWGPPERYLGALEGLDPIAWDLSSWAAINDILMSIDALEPEERELLLEHARVRYAAEVAWMDDSLAAIWADLDDAGALGDALVLIFADHGEQFWERGGFMHGQALHVEETEVFAVLWTPDGQVSGGWGGPTTHADLAPTLLDALGLEIPSQMLGVPVGTARGDRPRFLQDLSGGAQLSVIVDGQQLIYQAEGPSLSRFALDGPEPGADLHVAGDPESAGLWELLGPRVEATACASQLSLPTPDL